MSPAEVVVSSLLFGVAAFCVLLGLPESLAGICWCLVYLARGLERASRCCGSLLYESRLRGWFSRRAEFGGPFEVRMLKPLGRAIWAPASWMYPAAVSLVILANKGLPPLPKEAGFLARLYPRPGDW